MAVFGVLWHTMENYLITIKEDALKALVKEALREVLNEKHNQDESVLINIQEAAAFLNLAVSTICEKTSERLIPHYKHGKKIMFKRSELLAWVENRRVKTVKEIRQEAITKLNRK